MRITLCTIRVREGAAHAQSRELDAPEGDRLEVSPRLLVDPREARRRRAERQGDVRVVTCGRHGGRRRPEAE